MPPATQIKSGQVLILDGELYKILKLEHITPGKGNAVVQADLRGLKSGVKTEKRFRSSENVDVADMLTRKMQYLYEDAGVHHFMDSENYEQHEVSEDILGDSVYYLIPETVYEVDLHENRAVGIEVPTRMTFPIIQTDPGQKGAAGKTKPATLQGGLVIQVPLFIEEGESVVVNTEKKEYVERA